MGTGLIGKPTPPREPDRAATIPAARPAHSLFWEVSIMFCAAFLLALGVLLLWHP